MLPHSHLQFHPHPLLPNPNPNPFPPSPPRHCRRLLAAASASPVPRLQNAASPPLLTSSGGEDALAVKLAEEASVVPRRRHRFPGSIDFPSDSPPSPEELRLVVADDGVLRRALEVRREVASDVLVAALREGKLSANYASRIASRLAGFVDRVVVEAAAMRRDRPELAHLSFNARARTYVEESGVVAVVKWLKHNTLTYTQIGKVLCSCPGNLKKVRWMVQWLRSIHVKGEYLGQVLIKAESLLSRRFEELEEITGYLESWGVRRDWMGFVASRCPQLLTLSMQDLETRVRFYTDMGMNEKDFGTMVYDYPRVLGFFSLDEMNSKVQYLKEFGLSTEEVGRLLAFKPLLMACSIEERWKPLVKYLYYLNVTRDGMKRMLMVQPVVFCVDLETTIAPKVRFLLDIGVRDEAIGSVLVKFPAILTYSLERKIRPVVIFLMTRAGVTQQDIGKVIALDPQLVGCSIVHKLDISVKYLRSLGIHLNVLGQMIADFPMLLRYNPEVLRPKYRYLRRVMVRPLKDLIEFPRFFSYSLERIVRRHKTLVANRINMKLRYMLVGSDDDFKQRVQDAVERRARFEAREANLDTSISNAPQAATKAAASDSNERMDL